MKSQLTQSQVVSIFYIEPASEMRDSSRLSKCFTTVAHDGVAYHEFRRFIVIREEPNLNHCYALSVALPWILELAPNLHRPISTYSGRATTNPNVDASAHAMAYTGRTPPPTQPGERLAKDPIRIIPTNPSEKLDPNSRINFRKIVHIDHGWRTKDVGMVDEKSMPKLLSYYREHNHNK